MLFLRAATRRAPSHVCHPTRSGGSALYFALRQRRCLSTRLALVLRAACGEGETVIAQHAQQWSRGKAAYKISEPRYGRHSSARARTNAGRLVTQNQLESGI